VNFAEGPSLLAQTITANLGIPIQHVVVVSFAGLMNSVDAIGGIYLDFRYPAKDEYSGLNIKTTGCQLVTRFQALAVARSRHYEWYQNGVWNFDGTSDFGRIIRQDAFMRAMINRVRGLYNPLTINAFLSKVPQGITLDDNFTLNDLIEIAVKFHGMNPNAMLTYTLPTIAGTNASVGDVLYVDQPAAQQMLVDLYGNTLLTPPIRHRTQNFRLRCRRRWRPPRARPPRRSRRRNQGRPRAPLPRRTRPTWCPARPRRPRCTTRCPAAPRRRSTRRDPGSTCSTRAWRT